MIVATYITMSWWGRRRKKSLLLTDLTKNSEYHSKQFEYKCGAVEIVSPVFENGCIRKSVLNHKNIQEQICDILEGEEDALEQRAGSVK